MTQKQMVTLKRANARGEIIKRLMEFPEEKKEELFKKYKHSDEKQRDSIKCKHAIFVGTWMNYLCDMIIRGMTEAEFDDMMNHFIVVVNAFSKNLNITESAKDFHAHEMLVKYLCAPDNPQSEERKAADRKQQQQLVLKKRETFKLKKEGLSNQEIAEKLDIPESTVRFFTKNLK